MGIIKSVYLYRLL
jgi:hypothetical protein